MLTQEQKLVFKHINSGQNVLVTGPAGTGKSYLLKYIVSNLPYKKIAVTATTGIAAYNIEGTTLHSYTCMGLDLNKKPFLRYRADILIIDEISMLTKTFFDVIYPYIKHMQLVCFGDFLQLPPVNDVPCFTSPNWENLGFKRFNLETVVRQKDLEFVKVLNQIRYNAITPESIQYLKKLDTSVKKIDNPDKITKLYALNVNVDRQNSIRLSQLDTEEYTLIANDSPNAPTFMLDKIIPSTIKIKIGARVMLVRNLGDGSLVNGSLGIVVGFDKVPIVEFDNGIVHPIGKVDFEVKWKKKKYKRTQIPIKLAWCLTIHKSQGLTLGNVLANLHGSFECGQIYTVLSRVTSPKGLYIDNVDTLLEKNKICQISKEYLNL